MKLRTLKRHFREGFKNSWRNSWMTIASIGAVTTTLILVATFLVLLLNINHIADSLENDVEIKVLVDLTATEEEREAIGEELESMSIIETVVFSSREQELENLKSSLGEDGDVFGIFDDQENPLDDAYIVKLTDPQQTVPVAEEIATIPKVSEVNYGEDFVQDLFNFNNYARNIGLVLIIALVFTAIFLISNTIKITIFARRKEIEIMKLVGATNWFIRWPFFVEGLLLGILGSVIPIAALVTGYYYLDQNIETVNQFDFITLLPFSPFVWQVSGLILLIGAVIGIWGSVMSVRKFLKV
ncbi:cell division protein FtsX [Streptohalobacillus salinus]|uniref:Cell division protein FtsX n=1 Tax=Streptohalobacillus salinus TaxID=621096 RepID=A0A2V3WS27_9BACI|nr:permease-like cell division protein FtsX [Streptohalobacillus salinus]PXW91489.1 cell division protein FtsX [Streptohalobacillus salinus]